MLFGVLGPPTVWDEAGEPVVVGEAKARALLALLLAHEGRTVSAGRLLDALWGEDLPRHPANALQGKVSQLRRALGRDRVERRPPGYRLRLEPGETDADRFRTLLERARDGSGTARERADRLTEALALWRGPAYDGYAASYPLVRTAALGLEELRLTALEDRAEARLELGEHPVLCAELGELVARHPLRERLRGLQLRALYGAGRQSEALASYADLRNRLADELGLDPGPELAALHQRILTQDLEPGATVQDRPRAHLPAPLTGLVGREAAVAETAALLAGVRLVTLTGPGGVGKTALAVEAAARFAERYAADCPDGVWFVEPAGRHEGPGGTDSLAEVLAGALGVRDDGTTGAAERLAAALRGRRALLVLDNCEQAADAAARLVALLLRTAPGLRVLATSREPLGPAAETVRVVEPLPQDDAVRLFAARAAAAAPGFALDGHTRGAVEEICRRLDGLPLALELAATRVRALGVHELAGRLDDRFRLLGGGRRGVPERQQTLRAVIDWSWELLPAPERIVLRRLSVHADGCSTAAAEAVCAGEGVAREDVVELLARLVDRSLVVAVPDGPYGTRYRLLESVAAYAAERLREAEDPAAVRARHLRHYTALAEEARPGLRGPRQGEWLRRLDTDGANLRAALDTAADLGDGASAARLVAALSWYWLLRGRLNEARRRAEAALSLPGATDDVRALHGGFALLTGQRVPLVRPAEGAAEAEWFHAYALFHTGEPAAAEALAARALAGFEAAGDRWGTAAVLGLRSLTALLRGDAAAQRRDGERSAALFRDLGDRWGELQSVGALAQLAEIRGDYAEAGRLLTTALAHAEELDLGPERVFTRSRLGRVALLTGDHDRARELHERARRDAAEQGFKFGEVHAELGLALTLRRQGAPAAAEPLLRRIHDWYREVSEEGGNALVLAELGFIAELRGDVTSAYAHHHEALRAAHALGDPRGMALPLEGLAATTLLAGHPSRAAALLGAAAAARAAAGAPLPAAERGDVDRVTSGAREALGKDGYEAAYEAGWARGWHEVVREVLECPDTVGHTI
ncbi:SARP family transcriptional regulator [Streptomyces mashuensis]|uniref:SARP family transcriptional regulator n=1 Tax=Streptomyces mashuensis TaxID=33904 RepID=A0A919B2F5_9ACTN|nr:BTAD domain-containing putative transcriptional regulator [Streptomyces mashuensis]GHF45795.1 SARP family transcriptional regulator [Streptomyces mashuensis]